MVEVDGAVGVGVVGGGVEAARLADERCDLRAMESDYVRRFHRHEPRDHQCSSAVAKHIKAPVHLVWSLVRRFDQPQLFKPFVSRCEMKGNIEIGSVREVNVKSGLPATRSTERLELLDDNEHILSVKFVGGDHRLKNYSSILTVHPEVIEGRPGTLVIESFVVDVPKGNTKDETCYFVETNGFHRNQPGSSRRLLQATGGPNPTPRRRHPSPPSYLPSSPPEAAAGRSQASPVKGAAGI